MELYFNGFLEENWIEFEIQQIVFGLDDKDGKVYVMVYLYVVGYSIKG